MKDKLIVYAIESITPGARHVWLQTNHGRIRKPIGQFKTEQLNDEIDTSQASRKTVLVERELLNWGRWLVKCTVGGLGYPSQASIVTALQGSRSTTTPNLPTNPEAERLEGVVKRIERDHLRWGEVLRNHYTRELDETAAQVAKQLEIPHQTYFYYLSMGRKSVERILKTS